jgi:integrase/recombinase XerD
VLGLRFDDLQVADRRLAVVEGKGGHHRVVPAADRFFAELGCYLHEERPPAAATDRVFTALKGPRRGQPQSAAASRSRRKDSTRSWTAPASGPG